VIPEGITRSRTSRFNVARPPATGNTSIQRPLARHRVMLSRRVVAYYGLIRASEFLPATYGFAAEAAAPKENGLRWESRGSPIYSAGLCSRAASLTPVAPKSANDCCFPFGVSLHLLRTGSATTLVVSRLQSSLRVVIRTHVTARELASPPFEDVYIRACANPGHPKSASNMTTWVNSQFPRPDFHRQVQRHYGLHS